MVRSRLLEPLGKMCLLFFWSFGNDLLWMLRFPRPRFDPHGPMGKIADFDSKGHGSNPAGGAQGKPISQNHPNHLPTLPHPNLLRYLLSVLNKKSSTFSLLSEWTPSSMCFFCVWAGHLGWVCLGWVCLGCVCGGAVCVRVG